MTKRHYKILLLSLLFVLVFSSSMFAGGKPPRPPHPKPGLPIDGGVLALLAAGAVYAVKKIRDNGR